MRGRKKERKGFVHLTMYFIPFASSRSFKDQHNLLQKNKANNPFHILAVNSPHGWQHWNQNRGRHENSCTIRKNVLLEVRLFGYLVRVLKFAIQMARVFLFFFFAGGNRFHACLLLFLGWLVRS